MEVKKLIKNTWMNRNCTLLILIIFLFSCRNISNCNSCIIDAVQSNSTSGKILIVNIQGKDDKIYPVVLEKSDMSSFFSDDITEFNIDNKLIDIMCNTTFIYLHENQEKLIADFIPHKLNNESDIIGGGKAKFLKNFFDDRGFLNSSDRKMQTSIIYLAFTQWRILTYRDDESGSIRITKCSRDELNW
jgi:hypothetical protein